MDIRTRDPPSKPRITLFNPRRTAHIISDLIFRSHWNLVEPRIALDAGSTRERGTGRTRTDLGGSFWFFLFKWNA